MGDIQLTIVIPCYNEASRGDFKKRLQSVEEYMEATGINYEVILFDDCSKDNTYYVLNEFGENNDKVTVVHMDTNRGKSYSLKQGFEMSRGEYTMMMDADLSIELEHIKEFYDAMLKQGYDVVLACRQNNESNRGIQRRLISKLSGLCTKFVLGIDYKDTQCGFKMFNTKQLRKVIPYIRSDRWLIDIELLIYMQAIGSKILSVDVLTINDLESTLRSGEALKSSIKELINILKVKRKTIKQLRCNVGNNM